MSPVTLDRFAVTRKWPAKHPDRLQLYSLATPNGQKVSIMLEEIGLPYEAHYVNIMTGEQLTPEFLSVSPNNKIPAILDPHGPDGAPLALFESAAILTYLADKTGQLLPTGAAARYHALQWLSFQIANIGPMFGQLGFFVAYAGKEIEDKRPRDRYVKESQRLLGVLNTQLAEHPWILGEDYSIVDIATLPWVASLSDYLHADELLGMDQYPHVRRAVRDFKARPAVQRGAQIPAAP